MPRRRIYSQLDFQLTRYNVSYTEARNRIFVALKQSQPCSLEELIERLQGEVSRRTVYRAIKLFEQLGLIYRPEGKLIHLKTSLIQHRHELTCTQCGRTIPYRNERLERAIEALAQSRNFTMTGHSLNIVGSCGKHVDQSIPVVLKNN